MIVRPGMWLRLTRNLDKKRGFCNGAMGQVIDVLRLQADGVMFTMRLTHGAMVVVHPIRLEGDCFLPCVYGYAMTTRKAQGSSVDYAVLYFDLFRPASRGFAYVGASRVRHHTGLYYFGKMRRSDWLSTLLLNGAVGSSERHAICDDGACSVGPLSQFSNQLELGPSHLR